MCSFSTVLLVVATLATLSFTAPAAWDITIADDLAEIVQGVDDIAGPAMTVVDEFSKRNRDLKVVLDI
ncbi:hypothetical protein J132_11148 [Termitomyces sp. J132]|nr:hypothetical protein H2248_005502 [Termitomyces sp. 'cryptogamus']KNZ76222.1 hypothetical protein J132_11148 [Termitomyces sp. J132]